MRCDRFMNGWIGRELPGLCRDAGFLEAQVLPRTPVVNDIRTCDRTFALRDTARRAADGGLLVPSDAAEWIAGLEESDRNGRFFCSLTTFLVSCRKASGSLHGF